MSILQNNMDISVIVPLYKGEKYINKLINMFEENMAFLKNKNLELETELIFINDYPNDKLSLDKDYKNIKIVNKEKNEGIHASRIKGIDLSSGKYILMLDQDDEITKDFLYYAYLSIKDNDVLVLNGYKEIDSNNKEKIYKTKSDVKRLLHKKSFFVSYCQIESPGHCLIKKESIPQEWHKYIMKTNCADDLFLWILMVSKGCKFKFVNQTCYIHKYTGANLSLDIEKKHQSNIEMISYLRSIEYVNKSDLVLLEIRRRMNARKPNMLDKYSYVYGYYVLIYMVQNAIFRKKL